VSIRGVLSRLIAKHRPRFLWSSFAFPDGCGVAAEARRHNLPHVISLLGSDINLNRQYSARWRAIMKSLNEAKLILAKSKALGDAVTSDQRPATSDQRPPVHLDYNGVDQSLFHPGDRTEACRQLGLDPQAKRILFVGNLVPVKDVATLIRAFGSLTSDQRPATSDLQLCIIGSGPEDARLRHLASDLRLPASDLLFLGSQSREQVVRWMRACDLLCLPSLNEGVPNVVLEALASGRPVVASRVGGTPEIHPGEQGGALFDVGNVQELARCLQRVLTIEWDSATLQSLVSEFTWDRNAEKVMSAFERITYG